MKQNMKYCIGEFASILGVTSDTLRLYEKHGIVQPIKNEQNNYRYFHDLDARNLLMSRWYRSIQIPLQDVASLIRRSSSHHISKKIDEAKLKLEEDIRKSTALLERMNVINEEIKQVRTLMNQYTIKHFPGMYRLKQTNKSELLQSRRLKGVVNEWMNMLPFAFYSFRIDWDPAAPRSSHAIDYSWGITLYENDFHESDLEMITHVEYIAPATCLSTIILTNGDEHSLRESLEVLMDYAVQQQYVIAGDIRGRLIVTEKTDTCSRSYLEVNLPILNG